MNIAKTARDGMTSHLKTKNSQFLARLIASNVMLTDTTFQILDYLRTLEERHC